MKRLILICSLVVLVAALASTAKAIGITPAVWDFSLETHGSEASWTSSTTVITGSPQYEYDWALSSAELLLTGIGWWDVLPYIPSGDKSGSGTEYGLPFVVLDKDVGQAGVFTAHVLAGVDASGSGYTFMTDVVLGVVDIYGVEGFRCGGEATVTAVPEPTTVCLLGLGALSLLRRKHRAVN